MGAGLSMPSTLSESIYPQVVNSSRELEAFQPLPSDVLVPGYFQFPVFPVSVCVVRIRRKRRGGGGGVGIEVNTTVVVRKLTERFSGQFEVRG